MTRKTVIILLLILIATALFAGEDEGFYFIQITDTHLEEGEAMSRMEKAISAINSLPVDIAFVAITGDIMADNVTDSKIVREVKKMLKDLSPLLFIVPGNHDISQGEKQDEMLKKYRQQFGDIAYSKIVNDVELIFWFSEPARLPGLKIEGYDVFGWLENELETESERPCIIFMHSAPVKDFYNNSFHFGWPAKEEKRFREIVEIRESRVRGILCGHFHRDELHMIGNIPLFIAPSLVGFWGRQASIRLYHYKESGLTYRTIYLE